MVRALEKSFPRLWASLESVGFEDLRLHLEGIPGVYSDLLSGETFSLVKKKNF